MTLFISTNNKMNKSLPQIIAIIGPTASGKTALAVDLARSFNGEIISADSRQVYRGLDIGTGKDLAAYGRGKNFVQYHLIDVASFRRRFTIYDYQRLAQRAIIDILKRGKVPIVVGGSGLYLDALLRGYVLPESKLNIDQQKALRAKIASWSFTKLKNTLQKIDPITYRTIDLANRRRVERAVEIYYLTGQAKSSQTKVKAQYNVLWLGVERPLPRLRQLISQRLTSRFRTGLITEVKKLHQQGLSWKRCAELGLEYALVARHLQGELTRQELGAKLEADIYRFAKRQLTWWRRYDDIVWVKNKSEAMKEIKKFLK